ncbi:MAG: cellulase family glycosylhydrolase [Opitutaceae bacterium]|nr:cellulase family glycosylhydrolase [Opitutaceae bacterium]
MPTKNLFKSSAVMALAVLACAATAWSQQGAARSGRFVTVAGEKFIDPSGRQLLLHGINIVDKSAHWTDYPWVGEAEYAAMKAWGFNCVRLGFTWASIEPEPGVYSEQSLAEIAKRVAWAKKHGLYVYLDMHQDLFSMKYSDGAPEWATLTDGKPHVADGKVWSDAYLTSEAVQTAFDNFYANKPGPGGVGLQDRYAQAWKFLAKHFADDPTVIGYDLMNEPFAGSLVAQGMGMFAESLAREYAKEGVAPEAMPAWSAPEGRAAILKKLEDPGVYARVLDSAQPLYQEFERAKLMPLFQRIADAIRQVDRNHIIFLETCGSANMGVYSGIEPLKDATGGRDSLQAYAPHGYDLVTDTPEAAAASGGRVGLIFSRHGETAKRLRMPVIVGEWGAYYGNPQALPAAQVVCRQLEALLCGDTYWALEPDFTRQAVFQALCRPYPMRVTGTILEYRADPEAKKFTCSWKEEAGVRGETQLFVPAAFDPAKSRIKVTPQGKGCRIKSVPGGKNVYLFVPSTGRPVERRLVIE